MLCLRVAWRQSSEACELDLRLNFGLFEWEKCFLHSIVYAHVDISKTRPVHCSPIVFICFVVCLAWCLLQTQEALARSEQDPSESASQHQPPEESSLNGGSLGMYGWLNHAEWLLMEESLRRPGGCITNRERDVRLYLSAV